MKKLILLTLLCPVLMGVALTSTSPSLVNEGVVEFNQDLAVYAEDETGIDSKLMGVKGAVVGDATVANSETYYQKGVREGTGNTLIRFATAVKGDLKTLTYDLTYNGYTQKVEVKKVYKAISIDGVTTYYGNDGMTTDATKSTYYWACFTLEFKSETEINTRYHAKLNIVDSLGNETSTKVQSTSLGIMTNQYEVAFDGVMDDEIWTDSVKSKGYVVRNDGFEKTTVYGTRTDKGVYLFFDYEANADYSAGGAWYQGNNFELRFANKNGILQNKREVELNAANKNQYWISKYAHSSESSSNFTNVCLSDIVINENGRYNMTFETFVSYEWMAAGSNDVIGFDYGSNPGQLSWRTFINGNLDQISLENSLKITTEGLYKDFIPEHLCPEHEYGDYVVTTPASCKNSGEEARNCKWCNHVDTRIIESTGDHVWNYDDVTVITPATCTTTGVGSVPCNANCGETKDDVELPKDPMNHSAWDEALGKCTGCGSSLKEAYTLDKSNAGGWKNSAELFYAAKNLVGDFTAIIDLENYSNIENVNVWGDYCWKSVLTFIQDARNTNNNGAVWFGRMDWCAFVDWWDTGEDIGTYLNGDGDGYKSSWYPGNDSLFKSTLMHCDMRVTITRTGTDVRLDFVVVDQSNGNTYNYWYRVANISTEKPLNIAFNAEFAKVVFNNVYITQ